MQTHKQTVGVLASKVASADGLEVDDDLGQLDVPLLLQLRQHACTEEHLRVPDTVRGRVKVQSLQLQSKGEEDNSQKQPKNECF